MRTSLNVAQRLMWHLTLAEDLFSFPLKTVRNSEQDFEKFSLEFWIELLEFWIVVPILSSSSCACSQFRWSRILNIMLCNCIMVIQLCRLLVGLTLCMCFYGPIVALLAWNECFFVIGNVSHLHIIVWLNKFLSPY